MGPFLLVNHHGLDDSWMLVGCQVVLGFVGLRVLKDKRSVRSPMTIDLIDINGPHYLAKVKDSLLWPR